MSTELEAISRAEGDLMRLERDQTLLHDENFVARAGGRERIEFIQMVGRLQGNEDLVQRAAALRRRLDGVDGRLYPRVRADIRRGGDLTNILRGVMDPLTGYRSGVDGQRHLSYEPLDEFMARLFLQRSAPIESLEREPEMIYYEPVPASVILELVDRVPLESGDHFYDLGSGLGQVAVLVHLLTGAYARGIEIDPAYVAYAGALAVDLGLDSVDFIAGDAREAPLAGGVLYFLFTPFTGRILDQVMGRLYTEARSREIVVAAFGPCVARVAAQRWLRPRRSLEDLDFRLAIFDSV